MRVPRLILIPILVASQTFYTLQVAAQQAIGTVGVQDATVSGDLSITNGRAMLIGSTTILAKDHTAEIALNRGGSIRVCATSGLHLTQSQTAPTQPAAAQTTAQTVPAQPALTQPVAATAPTPLLLGLDRGAIEVHAAALASDVIMTPDLRFAVRYPGPLDLRLRVTRNGDTCVENRGASAPTLAITDQFGEAAYELRPAQHVLFEHGSLKEVVDNETSPCGCPAPLPGMSIADAIIAPPGTIGSDPKAEAATQHPFPAAVSEGLAPPPPVPQAPPNTAHAQVAPSLGLHGHGSGTVSRPPPPRPTASPTATPTLVGTPSTAPAPPPSTGLGHRLGHFFKRLFGGS